MIDDKSILTLSPEVLFSKEIFDEIYDIEDEPDRARLIGIFKQRAKQLNLEKEASGIIKAYNNADKKLAQQYTRMNAKQNGEIVLEYESKGGVAQTTDNFVKVLESDEQFKGIKYNLMTHSPEQERDGVTEKWTDADDAKCRHYIEKKYHFFNSAKCSDALQIVFDRTKYNPIIDLIETIKWDKKPRICEFLHFATMCEDTPYTREVSRLIFAGGINRLYNPGCKFDDVPVLIGTKQGEGKSTLVRWLAMQDEFYAEVSEFEGKDGMESIEGVWICELGELLALTKAKEIEAVKSFITRQVDHFRKPYERRTIDYKRQCIFIGTTNKEQFLTDKTGNRRFYPVKVNQSGYDLFDKETEIKSYIRQCWAEARELYKQGKLKPFANRELVSEIRAIQSAAVEDDYRVGMIQDYLEDKNTICILELWQEALKMGDFSKPSKKESNEIGLIMQTMDEWEKQPKVKRFSKYGIQKHWKRKGSEDEEIDDIEL